MRPLCLSILLLSACSTSPSLPVGAETGEATTGEACSPGTALCACLGAGVCDGTLVCEGGFCVEPGNASPTEDPTGSATSAATPTTATATATATDGSTGGSSSGEDESSSGSGECDPGADACTLAPPLCGCADDEGCDVNDAGIPECIPRVPCDDCAGPYRPEGESCVFDSPEHDTCEPGLLCVHTGEPFCHRFCETNDHCVGGPGSICAWELSADLYNGVDPVAPTFFCTLDCDPVDEPDAVCGGIGDGTCDLVLGADGVTTGTYCRHHGFDQRQHGEACAGPGDWDCGDGTSCLGGVCRRLCRLSAPASSCPDGSTCTAFTPAAEVGDIEYGACV